MPLKDSYPLQLKTVFKLNFDFWNGPGFLSHGQKAATNAGGIPQMIAPGMEKCSEGHSGLLL